MSIVKELVEKRVIESTKKQVTTKSFSVAKNLGKPIISQGIFDWDFWQNQEEFPYDPKNIPVIDPDSWSTSERGYYFDGLKLGINLCITALTWEDKLADLKTTYNGFLVFAEIDGELKAYAPFEQWEKALDMFYEAAINVEQKRQEQNKILKQERNKNKLQKIWNKLRTVWGY